MRCPSHPAHWSDLNSSPLTLLARCVDLESADYRIAQRQVENYHFSCSHVVSVATPTATLGLVRDGAGDHSVAVLRFTRFPCPRTRARRAPRFSCDSCCRLGVDSPKRQRSRFRCFRGVWNCRRYRLGNRRRHDTVWAEKSMGNDVSWRLKCKKTDPWYRKLVESQWLLDTLERSVVLGPAGCSSVILLNATCGLSIEHCASLLPLDYQCRYSRNFQEMLEAHRPQRRDEDTESQKRKWLRECQYVRKDPLVALRTSPPSFEFKTTLQIAGVTYPLHHFFRPDEKDDFLFLTLEPLPPKKAGFTFFKPSTSALKVGSPIAVLGYAGPPDTALEGGKDGRSTHR
jgi:hypothetical protein